MDDRMSTYLFFSFLFSLHRFEPERVYFDATVFPFKFTSQPVISGHHKLVLQFCGPFAEVSSLALGVPIEPWD